MLFKEKLRFEREKRGLSMRELSLKCEFSEAYIWRIESGRRQNLELKTLKRIADAMSSFGLGEISGSELIQDTEYDRPTRPRASSLATAHARANVIQSADCVMIHLGL